MNNYLQFLKYNYFIPKGYFLPKKEFESFKNIDIDYCFIIEPQKIKPTLDMMDKDSLAKKIAIVADTVLEFEKLELFDKIFNY